MTFCILACQIRTLEKPQFIDSLAAWDQADTRAAVLREWERIALAWWDSTHCSTTALNPTTSERVSDAMAAAYFPASAATPAVAEAEATDAVA